MLIEENMNEGEGVRSVTCTFLQIDAMDQSLADKKRAEEKEESDLAHLIVAAMTPNINKQNVAVESGRLLAEVLDARL